MNSAFISSSGDCNAVPLPLRSTSIRDQIRGGCLIIKLILDVKVRMQERPMTSTKYSLTNALSAGPVVSSIPVHAYYFDIFASRNNSVSGLSGSRRPPQKALS